MALIPISIEFFPPNTPVGSEKLKTVVRELSALKPEFFSVTYGAGGSTREKTLATVRDIAAASGFNTLSHFSFAFGKCFGRRPSDYRQAWPKEDSTPSWPGTLSAFLETLQHRHKAKQTLA